MDFNLRRETQRSSRVGGLDKEEEQSSTQKK